MNTTKCHAIKGASSRSHESPSSSIAFFDHTSIHVPSTTPQMKLPFFVFKFAVSFVSAIADRNETRLCLIWQSDRKNGPRCLAREERGDRREKKKGPRNHDKTEQRGRDLLDDWHTVVTWASGAGIVPTWPGASPGPRKNTARKRTGSSNLTDHDRYSRIDNAEWSVDPSTDRGHRAR